MKFALALIRKDDKVYIRYAVWAAEFAEGPLSRRRGFSDLAQARAWAAKNATTVIDNTKESNA